ncbi:Uu.00g142640.m01.CDS01 [Anthostomella pinea]|uniref:Uu.00g142640.m01.CDS01 n=1 Tax=Anthostomella pinea TaxID=933095 RepID=A0AAI8VRF1_9PEZI|nr:Uu.00g142640.m01.CDS01 [Anthostomella pinea]
MGSYPHLIQGRLAYITPDSQATGVSIATWFLATTFLIMYLSGQTVKYLMLQRFRLDDYFMLLATIFSFGLSVSYSIAASNGLGNRTVSSEQMSTIQKAYYAADVLYVPSVCLVKISLLVFIRQIAIETRLSRFVLSLVGFTAVGGVAATLAAAFQCQTPTTWEIFTPKCFNQSGFWVGFGVIDMLTDVSIVVASVVLVWNVQLAFSRKAVVVACFAPQILVIITAACRLAYLVPVTSYDNPAFRSWIAVVCTEVQVCLSVSTACIPGVKPLFEAIEAGVWQSDELRRRGLSLDNLHSRGYLKNTGSWMELSDAVSNSRTNMAPSAASRNIDSREGVDQASIQSSSQVDRDYVRRASIQEHV